MENNPIVNLLNLLQKVGNHLLKIKLLIFLMIVGSLTLIHPTYGQSTNNSQLQAKSESQINSKRKITGIVIDGKGEGVIGATVLAKGIAKGTITNTDGRFSLEVPVSLKSIVITYVGYNPTEVNLNAQNSYRIVLSDASMKISEVVVVGYGYQKKETMVGAISQVSTEALVRSGTTNITNAIAGKLSGVLTIQSSGQPGANNSEIVIRGLSSWNGSSPLVLVDGVERDFTGLDPNEISTVSVLKDASATAVFGAKGANGVILVTTKRGALGKPQLNVSASYGIQTPTRLPEHISSYTTMSMMNYAFKNRGLFDKTVSQTALNEYQHPSSLINSIRYPDNNWFDMLTNPISTSDQANINISGGTKFVKYFASFGYTHEGDFFQAYNVGFDDTRYKNDRINYRTNLDFQLSPKTQLSVNLGGDVDIKNGHVADPWQSLYGASPSMYPAYFPEWFLQQVPDPTYPDAFGIRRSDKVGEYFDNPYNLFYSGAFSKKLTSKLFTDLLLTQKLDFITKGLGIKGKVSLSTSFTNEVLNSSYSFPTYTVDFTKIGVAGANPWTNKSQSNLQEIYTQSPLSIGIGSMTGDYYTNMYYELGTDYNCKFGKNTISALALMNFQQKFLNSDFGYYNAGVVGRATYDYAGKYLFEANVGYTGSERFAPANRFGVFPSVAIGWIVSEEPFFKFALPVVNKLKFRYSDGLVGSDNASNRWLYISNYTAATQGQGTNLSGASNAYITEDKAANSVAQWEMARKKDLGIEVGLFNNDLRFSVDLYDEFRDNMLLTPNSVTFFVGNSFKELNLGSMKKHGFEVELEYNKTLANKLNYYVKGNFGFNENRIIFKDDLPYALEYQKLAGTLLGGALNGVELNGQSYFTSVNDLHLNPVPVTSLTDANVGDYQYLDYNGDGAITTDDKHPIEGSQYPPITYSFSGGLSYKGFDFSFMFQGNSGKYVNYNGAFEYEFLKGNTRVHQSSLDYWTPTNPNANHSTLTFNLNNDPKLTFVGGAPDATNGYEGALLGRTWRNADYLRLKEVYLGYTFKSEIIKRALGVKNICVYATGNNLITFTQLLEGDPEAKNFMNGFYPQMVSGNLGFKLSF